MKQSKILKVGLTGGIGTGKSTVSNIFKEYDIPIVDADIIARKVLTVHPKILDRIKVCFGGEYFDSEGNLLRKKMGSLIFSDKKSKKKYEEIILPYIKGDIYSEIEEYDKNEESICIIDAPTLIENNIHVDMDKVIVVSANEEVQINRVMLRDGYSRGEALLRIESQMSTEEKCKYADFIVNNNGNIHSTKEQIKQIINKLQIIRGKNDL